MVLGEGMLAPVPRRGAAASVEGATARRSPAGGLAGDARGRSSWHARRDNARSHARPAFRCMKIDERYARKSSKCDSVDLLQEK